MAKPTSGSNPKSLTPQVSFFCTLISSKILAVAKAMPTFFDFIRSQNNFNLSIRDLRLEPLVGEVVRRSFLFRLFCLSRTDCPD